MNIKPGDSKREEFRKYLEKSGLLDALTKALVKLYEEPEKPPDALAYFKKNLKVDPEVVEVSTMKSELVELQEKVKRLSMENKDLQEKVVKTEPSEEETADTPETQN